MHQTRPCLVGMTSLSSGLRAVAGTWTQPVLRVLMGRGRPGAETRSAVPEFPRFEGSPAVAIEVGALWCGVWAGWAHDGCCLAFGAPECGLSVLRVRCHGR